VEAQSHLIQLVHALWKEPAIGVDLEADSMFHYPEKVCLLQIATPSQTVLLDPLSLRDLSELSPVFSSSKVRKVFHGADYDIRCLHRDFGIEVQALFDTQVAARFLGLKETGLASLLQDRFGVAMEKKYRKRDWSKRPLPASMIRYAAEDAHYLLLLARHLEAELKDLGRLSWAEEECRILSKVRHMPAHDQPLFVKFKGSGRLDRRGLAVLEAVLQFREERSRKLDRPPFKVLGNGPILNMAQKRPRTRKALSAIEGISPAQLKAFGSELAQTIAKALTLPEASLPEIPKKARRRYSPRAARRIKALKDWRAHRAAPLGLDPALLCPNAIIHSLVQAVPENPEALSGIGEMRDWQRKEFGSEILLILKQTT
jgi:ribonuclease D